MIAYRKIHEMIIMIVLIGLINLYLSLNNVKLLLFNSINIQDQNLLYLILIFSFFFLIFFNHSSSNLEFELILALGLSAIFFILISNELLLFFLALELYSLSVYLLLYQNNLSKSKITIVYFLIGSISSSLLLFAIALFYLNTGSLDISFIFQNLDSIYLYHNNPSLLFAISLFFICLLFKIGAAPFQFWVIRVYSQMSLNVIIYQSIVPKIFYIYFILTLISKIDINSIISPYLFKLLIFSSFISLLVGSIGPLTHNVNHFKTILAYSSILHVGYLLLGIAASLYTDNNISMLNIFQYLLIYSANTFHLFLAFHLLNKSNFSLHKNLFFSSLLLSIFSFIGLPPFAGFFAKLNIFLNAYLAINNIFIIAILLILVSTIIAAFLYLKFINSFYFENIALFSTNSIPLLPSVYLFSFFSLFLLLYPLFLPYLSPLFDSLFFF